MKTVSDHARKWYSERKNQAADLPTSATDVGCAEAALIIAYLRLSPVGCEVLT